MKKGSSRILITGTTSIMIFFVLHFFPLKVFGQTGRTLCTPEVVAFDPGEKMQFDVYYNWGFVWLHAGEVEFSADTSRWNGQPAWQFLSTGKSRSSYDWFFKVRDRYESWASREDLKPLEFIRDTHEGGFDCYNHYLFNYASGTIKATTFTSRRSASVKTIPITGCLSDVLTATYITRNLDARSWTINQKIPLAMVLDDDYFDLYIRYLGKETITHRNKKRYECLKFSTTVVGGSIFKGGEAITVWVTDDKSHTPVLVQAEILVGSVKVYLRD